VVWPVGRRPRASNVAVVSDRLGGRHDEGPLLCGFLDWYRAVVVRKVENLPLEAAKRVMTPTGLSALGIVAHLGWVERNWFRWRFAGEDVTVLYGEDDTNAVQFALGPLDTVDSVVRHAGHLDIMREEIDGRTGD